MTIGTPWITVCGSFARWSVPIGAEGFPSSLWFEVEAEYENLLSERADSAMIALLVPAMQRHLPMVVEGQVTDELAYHTANHYQGILEKTNGLARVAMHTSNVAPAKDRATGVATGFSGGVDSFATLADHHYDLQMRAWGRLTHLIFNNNGSHGAWDQRSLWLARYRNLRPVADLLGLPFVAIDSNMDDFYERGSHQATHTPRDASVAHLLAGGINRWFYATGFSTWDSHAESTYDTAYSEPFTFPLLSTGAITLSQHGQNLSRVAKTARVAELPDAYEFLDVCVSSTDGSNCSRCPKCLRTLLTLEVLGKLRPFRSRFDLEIYREHRDAYFGRVLLSRDPLANEIRQLIRKNRFPVPLSAYKALGLPLARGAAKRTVRCAKRLVRR